MACLAETAKKLLALVRLKLSDTTKSLTLTFPWEVVLATKKSVEFEVDTDADAAAEESGPTAAPGFDAETSILLRRVVSVPLKMQAVPAQVRERRGGERRVG